ncbi:MULTISPECIES: adenosylcobinamide-GDP ribazoletransferase [Candidatus Nitrosocaldus]|jgi:adenosylcobinamide-GDP ribazoletransferase|uniref:Adenosylcobinamide-GDP ribazoletransferase n=1 Tax=Candidatus Nitrosocaldus cavascurensis TaxID=2058097 RepID=A0A2K5ANY7_9ARCH|nr:MULTISPECIES: adenosylcobinamide-GDP ribazoletransferase [Candidatus Nitrosocaldus]GBC74476.1 Adenosylcobinamide-GDP ribazoletransferase [archaeon HR05]SPC33347.1 Adenosylcobinamide-GDP ribazoletransferase [Candidatus Nitrosocaldus cavascurensis]
MGIIDVLSSLISFLSIIPIPKRKTYDIEYIAGYMFLFPIVGVLIGAIIGIVALLLSLAISNGMIVALLVIAIMLVITGMHHTDALADFADGIMAKGSREDKIKALRDPAIGAAGASILIMYILGLFIALSMLDGLSILRAIVVSECIAKYSMVLQASMGRVAWEGMGAPFVRAMKGKECRGVNWSRLIIATITTVGVAYATLEQIGVYAIIGSTAIAMLLLAIANRNFGGVSGDLFGATNELSRLTSLLVIGGMI